MYFSLQANGANEQTKSYLRRESRKRSLDNIQPAFPNKFPRQTYTQTNWQTPAIPPRYAPWPGQGPPPPGWNLGTQFPVSYSPPRPKMPRIKGTCFDFLEKGVCLRGAAVLFPFVPVIISSVLMIMGLYLL
jgi:hypothetical protein